jgi:hypothetical protein
MALIRNFEQLRQFIKFISSSDEAGGMIDTATSEIRYVLPILTPTLYNELNAAVAANNVPDNRQDLLTLARAVGAYMAAYHNLALLHVNITDTGLKTASIDDMQAARRWEYMEVKEHLIDQGSLAMESLITYLVANATTLSWNNPAYSGSIFKTGAEFSEYFFLHQPHRSFMSLRPLIREAEGYVQATMGSSYYEALKTIAEPSEHEAAVLDLAKKFVSHFSISKAVEKLSVSISPDGFTVLMLAANDKPADGKANAPDNQLSLLYNSAKTDAKMYLAKLKNYLDKYASADVFAEYFSSAFYNSPNKERCEGNSKRKGVFGL